MEEDDINDVIPRAAANAAGFEPGAAERDGSELPPIPMPIPAPMFIFSKSDIPPIPPAPEKDGRGGILNNEVGEALAEELGATDEAACACAAMSCRWKWN